MSIRDIESAADALPRSEQERLFRHLAANSGLLRFYARSPAAPPLETVVWPDYETRLRAIYGGKTMPSMVLAERETAAWHDKADH